MTIIALVNAVSHVYPIPKDVVTIGVTRVSEKVLKGDDGKQYFMDGSPSLFYREGQEATTRFALTHDGNFLIPIPRGGSIEEWHKNGVYA